MFGKKKEVQVTLKLTEDEFNILSHGFAYVAVKKEFREEILKEDKVDVVTTLIKKLSDTQHEHGLCEDPNCGRSKN